MKKLFLIIIILLCSVRVMAQLPVETFESTWITSAPSAAMGGPAVSGSTTTSQWYLISEANGPAIRWNKANNSGTQPAYLGTGAAFLNIENVASGLATDWLITPQFTVPTNGELRFFTRFVGATSGTTVKVYINTTAGTQGTTANYTQIASFTNQSDLNPLGTTYIQKKIQLPTTIAAGTQAYIAIVASGDSSGDLLIDNLEVGSRCPYEISTATATNIASGSAKLNWALNTNVSQWQYILAPGTSVNTDGMTPVTVTTNQPTVTATSSGAPLTVNTTYCFYVRSVCGGNTGLWKGPYTFTTAYACLLTPQNLSVSCLGNSATLSWNPIAGVSQYEVYIGPATSSSTAPPLTATYATVNANTYTTTTTTDGAPFALGTGYYAYVRSRCNGDGSPWQYYPFTTPAIGAQCVNPFIVSQLPYYDIGKQYEYAPYYSLPDPATCINLGLSSSGYGTELNRYYSKWYKYTATATGTINVHLKNGNAHTYMFVYDECSSTNCLNSGVGGKIEFNNMAVTAGEDYYILMIDRDQFAGTRRSSLIITSGSCSSSLYADYSVTSTTNQPQDPFTVGANIWNLGGNTSVVATPYINGVAGTPQTISTIGAGVTFGPYDGTMITTAQGYQGYDLNEVEIVIRGVQNSNCYIISPPLSRSLATAGANDHCSSPKVIIPKTTGSYAYQASGYENFFNSSDDPVLDTMCVDNDANDIWYEFVATTSKNYIDFNILEGHPEEGGLTHALYEGTDCNNLTQLYCSSNLHDQIDNLVVGQTYRIRVYDGYYISGNAIKFSLAVSAIQPSCRDTNPQSATVKQLFVELVNHLMDVARNGIDLTQPYECAQLTALAPYITDPDPKIYFFGHYTSPTTSSISFNFTDHPMTSYYVPDVNIMNISNEYLTDIDLYNYTTPHVATDAYLTFSEANYIDLFSNAAITVVNGVEQVYSSYSIPSRVKHVNFCPGEDISIDTPPVDCALEGAIKMGAGQECIVPGANTVFSLVTNGSATITSYSWIVSTTWGGYYGTSTLAIPTFNIPAVGNYTVAVTVTTSANCSTKFYLPVSVVASCEGNCTANPNTFTVKYLYQNLVNKLLQFYPDNPVPDGYTCPELTALAPYITDPNPAIYGIDYESGILKFKFSNLDTGYDVVVSDFDAISGFNITNFTSPSAVTTPLATIFTGGATMGVHNVRHVDFCGTTVIPPPPPPPCAEDTIVGTIKIDPGEECIITNTQTAFSFLTNSADIAAYSWVVLDGGGGIVYSSSLATPVFSFASQDSYYIELTLTTTEGCRIIKYRSFSVMNTCTGCTNTNPQSLIVKQLYTTLINKLLAFYPANPVPNGYNCPELMALAPYITDANPGIYGVNYTNNILKFRFGSSETGYDIVVPDNGQVSDFSILGFTSAANTTTLTNTIFANGANMQGHTSRHVNFCPATCPDLSGDINLNNGLSYLVANSSAGFNFTTTATTVTAYAWTFYALNSTTTVYTSSTLDHPFVTYTAAGSYTIKLVVSYGTGCTKTFYKTITVGTQTTAPSCTETSSNAANVKQLYKNLINNLITIYLSGNSVPNPYVCDDLVALAPYITDNNAKIWNVSYTGQLLKFSFNNHGTNYDVSVPAASLISDINLLPFTTPDSAVNLTTVYTNGTTSATHSVRHIDFCMGGCESLYGGIEISNGMSCITTGSNVNFLFSGGAIDVSDFTWTFYDQNGLNPYISHSSTPQKSFAVAGTYLVKLEVKQNNGCPSVFYKYVHVAATCDKCTETNEEAPVVKSLYISLLNHLLLLPSAPPDGYTCNELSELAPYITDGNPYIYGASYSANGTTLSFKFATAESQYDVIVKKYGTIVDIDLFNYTTSATSTNFNVVYANGTQAQHSVKHVNFCPDVPLCLSHVSFVFDESGSISEEQAGNIKAQMYAFIDQQTGSNMTVSFVGMSDSDDPALMRNDHIYGKITAANKQMFIGWIDKYKTAYTIARRNAHISANSDFWTTALQKAYTGFDLKPEIIIVITDGSQTSNVDNFKNIVQQINNDTASHLYVYGKGQGNYVDGTPSSGNPNTDITGITPISEVTLKLMTSLKFLLQLPPTQFPAYSQTDLSGAMYFEYPDFSYLNADLRYFSDKLALAGLGCGGAAVPKKYCNDCQTFQPVSGQTYWLSAWVKEERNIQVKNYINGIIHLVFEDANDLSLGEITFFPGGEIIDGWQRIAAKFEVPAYTSIMKIEIENLSANIPVYFDDIRVHPMNGSMKSYVYDPVTFKLMAELDDNNYSTLYEYDNEGGLIRIKKETSKGIKTIQESRSGTVINTGN